MIDVAELRKLVEQLKRDGAYYDPYAPDNEKVDGKREAYLEMADELQALLTRAEEPAVRPGQKLHDFSHCLPSRCVLCGETYSPNAGPCPGAPCAELNRAAPVPEQAARERLKAFLLAHEGSYYEQFGTNDSNPPVRIAIASVYMLDEHEDAFKSVDIERLTFAEAVNAALDRAEGKEPTP